MPLSITIPGKVKQQYIKYVKQCSADSLNIVILLSVIALCVILCNAECHFLNVIMLRVIMHADSCYAQCHFAGCLYS